jgi:hypothetical protein
MNDTSPFIAAPSNASIICFTDADCLNAGACSLAATINATCQCFRGYWGSNCAKGLYDLQGPLLIIHQVVMIPIFLALTIVAGINLAAAIILTKRASGRVVDRMVSILFGFALFGCFGTRFRACFVPPFFFFLNSLFDLAIQRRVLSTVVVPFFSSSCSSSYT